MQGGWIHVYERKNHVHISPSNLSPAAGPAATHTPFQHRHFSKVCSSAASSPRTLPCTDTPNPLQHCISGGFCNKMPWQAFCLPGAISPGASSGKQRAMPGKSTAAQQTSQCVRTTSRCPHQSLQGRAFAQACQKLEVLPAATMSQSCQDPLPASAEHIHPMPILSLPPGCKSFCWGRSSPRGKHPLLRSLKHLQSTAVAQKTTLVIFLILFYLV